MTKSRTGKKLLSLLLTLCMALSLMPAMGITASAGTPEIPETTVSISGTEPTSGTGWTWDGSTLTLSGVDLSATGKVDDVPGKDAICITGVAAATVVLEGTNKLTTATGQSGLYCDGTLTIKGSGTLEVADLYSDNNSNGVFSKENMTIESGYITAAVSNYGVRSGGSITVKADMSARQRPTHHAPNPSQLCMLIIIPRPAVMWRPKVLISAYASTTLSGSPADIWRPKVKQELGA